MEQDTASCSKAQLLKLGEKSLSLLLLLFLLLLLLLLLLFTVVVIHPSIKINWNQL